MFWAYLNDPEFTNTLLGIVFPLPSREHRLALLVECANPLAVILALVNMLPQLLNPLEYFGRERGSLGEQSELLLHRCQDQGGLAAHEPGQVIGEPLQVRRRHEMVENPPFGCVLGLDGGSGKEHFLDKIERQTPQEVQQADRVVGQAEVGWSDGKGAGFIADDEVAGQRTRSVAPPQTDP